MDKRKPIPRLPAPTRDEFYAWMLERFDLPEGTPLTRGFFEASRLLDFFIEGDLRAFWMTRGRMNARAINEEWRPQLAASLQLKDERELPQFWEKFPVSVSGWQTLRLKTKSLALSHPVRGNFTVRDGMTPGEAFLDAERLLRRDIEICGRAYVAEKGVNFYLKPLEWVPSVSAHETLDHAMRWRDLGLFAPHDADLQARFSDVTREHALWLKDHKRGQRARLCGRDLREVSWPKGALRGADLRGAILRNLNLEGDDLRGADLRWADLTAARLTDCRLSLVKLQGALLDFALISAAELQKLPLTSNNNSEWTYVMDDGRGVWHDPLRRRALRRDLSGCDLSGRVLRHLRNASAFDFTDCDLRGADLSGLNFNNSSYITSFRGADLRGANVWGASFNRCDLTDANLENLQGADWAQWNYEPPRARDFRGVKWADADLNRRNFTDCDLSGADLRRANLCFAHFTGANLSGADLRDCKMVQTVLQDANLSGCDLRGVKLVAVNLQGACLDGARLDKDALTAR